MQKGLNNMSKSELLKIIHQQEFTLKQKDETILTQKQWIDKMQRMLFGSKSERFIKSPVDPKQLHLSFEELDKKNNNQKEPDLEIPDKLTTPNRFKVTTFAGAK